MWATEGDKRSLIYWEQRPSIILWNIKELILLISRYADNYVANMLRHRQSSANIDPEILNITFEGNNYHDCHLSSGYLVTR